VRPLLVLVLVACSTEQAAPTKPEGAVAIYLQGIDSLPRLQLRVAGIEAEKHVTAIAGAIVEARKVCYAKPVAASVVAVLHVDIDAKRGVMDAVKRNDDGACLASQLDKHAVTDSANASLDVQVSVAK
jgi:hypothetical protein